MKQTPFHHIHTSLHARLVDFAGYEMPVQYTSIVEEHQAVRNSVGVFDVSHMGELEIQGRGALSFLQKTTINDVSKLFPGRVHYSAMCYENGGIIDDLLVYQLDQLKYMLVVNASNVQKDFEWLRSNVTGDVTIRNISNSIAVLAVQGPNSLVVLQKLTEIDLATVAYYHSIRTEVAGVPMIISRTGYTGELGFELYFDSSEECVSKVWHSIFEAGKEYSIRPVGLGARDVLRLEMGFCLYGNDIDQTTNPLEAGLGWITKLNKKEFIGKSALTKIKNAGPSRKLIGFYLQDKNIARHGFVIKMDEDIVGSVTSGTFSPSLQKPIGMGYIESKLTSKNNALTVSIRGKDYPMTVAQLPFLKK